MDFNPTLKPLEKSFTHRNPRTKHIRSAGIGATRRKTNVAERLNGPVRERNKAMRGVEREDTPVTKGFQIYYNLMKLHQALGGQTPHKEQK